MLRFFVGRCLAFERDLLFLRWVLVTYPAYSANFAEGRAINQTDKKQDLENFFSGREEKMKVRKSKYNIDKIFSRNSFDSNGEYLQAVIKATRLTEPEDLRLERATGLGEESQSEGGFLVKKELFDGFLYGETASELYRRCFKLPVAEGFLSAEIPMIHETSRAEGSHLGGLRLYFLDEADGVDISTPAFRSNRLELKKAIGICPVTDELMQDGPRMERFLSNVFGQALRYTIDQSIIRGTGSGRPMGLLHAPGTLVIDKQAGQDPATVVSQNILDMVASLPAESHGSACWVVNPELLEQLYKLNVEVGTGGSAMPLWKWKAGGELYNKLAGFDCIANEHCSAPGLLGDLFLADLSKYCIIEKKTRETISAHLYFLSGEQAFRLIYRFDGQPLWSAPIVPANGSSGKKISPFVTLASRN